MPASRAYTFENWFLWKVFSAPGGKPFEPTSKMPTRWYVGTVLGSWNVKFLAGLPPASFGRAAYGIAAGVFEPAKYPISKKTLSEASTEPDA